MVRGGRAAAFLAMLVTALSASAMEIRTRGDVPCQGLAALGPAIDQRLGDGAATSEAGLRLRIQGKGGGQRLRVSLAGASGQALFTRTVEAGTLNCEDLVASLSLLASIWIRQTSSLEASPGATRPRAPGGSRRAFKVVDAGAELIADAGLATPEDAGGGPNAGNGSDPLAIDAGAVDPDGGEDAGAGDAGIGGQSDAGTLAALVASPAGSDAGDPWRWDPHLGVAASIGAAVGDDGTVLPDVLGLRLQGAINARVRLEVAAAFAAPFTDVLDTIQIRVQQDELASRVAVAPFGRHREFFLVAGPTLDWIGTATSGAGSETHTLWNGGGELGARAVFPLGSRMAVELSLLAEVRAFRDELEVTRATGARISVGVVPPFWVLPELGLRGDAL